MAVLNVDAVIRAVDKFTGPMRRIMASTKPIAGRMAGVATATTGVGTALNGIVAPLAAITGGSAIAGLALMVRSFVHAGGAIQGLTEELGISKKGLQEFAYAASIEGLGIEETAAALVKFQKKIGEVAAGADTDGAEMFARLGIKARDAAGKVRTAEQVLPELAEAISKIENPTLRTRVAMEAFGKSGSKLLPFLKDGKDGLAAAAEEARRFGVILSDDAVIAADEFEKSGIRLRASMQGVGFAISEKIIPLIQPLVSQLTEWIAANRELIATKVEAAVERFANAVRAVDWDKFWQGVARTMESVEKFAQAVGGWENVIIGAVVLLNGSLVGAVINLGIALVQLSATALPAVASATMWLATTALPVLWAGLAIAAKAVLALGAAMLANPMGLFIAGVVAVAAAATLIYENWEPISAFFADLWEGIKVGFQAFAGWIGEKVAALAGVITAPVQAIANLIRAPIQALGGGLAAAFGQGDGAGARESMFAQQDSAFRQPSPLVRGMQQAGAGGAQRSTADVTIHIPNLPAGARVETDQSGSGMDLGVETGWQLAGALR